MREGGNFIIFLDTHHDLGSCFLILALILWSIWRDNDFFGDSLVLGYRIWHSGQRPRLRSGANVSDASATGRCGLTMKKDGYVNIGGGGGNGGVKGLTRSGLETAG